MIRVCFLAGLLTAGGFSQSITVSIPTLDFGNVPVGQTKTMSYSVSGIDLTDSMIVGAVTPFQVSLSEESGFVSQLRLAPFSDTVVVFVRFTPASAEIFSENINHSSGEASPVNVSVTASSFAMEPTIKAVSLAFSAIDSQSFTISWTPGNGNARVVVLRAGSEITTSPTDGLSYNASSIFGNGDESGNGNFVVYNGSGTSVAVQGLQKQQTYFAAVFEYNGSGGAENYLADSLAGSQITRSRAPIRSAQIPDMTLSEDFGAISFGGSLDNYFYDSDSPLTFSVSAPEGISASVIGNAIQLQSELDVTGTHQIVVTAVDEFPQAVRDTFLVTVQPVNDAPRVVAPISDGNVAEDASRVFIGRLSMAFEDPEDDPMTFTAVSADTLRLRALVSGDSLFVETVKDSNGSVAIYLAAVDPSFAEGKDTIVISVTPVSDPPMVAVLLRDTTFSEDFGRVGVFKLSEFFEDIDNDTLEYFFSLSATGVNPEIVGDSLYLNSLGNFFGTAVVVVSGFDGQSSMEDTMNVQVVNVNDVPRNLGFIDHLDVPEDEGRFFVALAGQLIVDDDNDPLTFSVSGSDTVFLKPTLSNDSLYLQTYPDSAGTAWIFLTAIDPSMTTVIDTFSVTVFPVSDAPFLQSLMRDTILPQNFGKVFVRKLSSVFADVDNASLNYQAWALNTGVVPFIGQDSLYLVSQPDFFGQCFVRVAASDGITTISDTFRVSVTDQLAPDVFLHALATPAVDVVRFVMGANENLSSLSIRVNDSDLTTTHRNGIYFADYRLSNGILAVEVSARDFAGNLDTLKRQYIVSSLAKAIAINGLMVERSSGYMLTRTLSLSETSSRLQPLGEAVEILATGGNPLDIGVELPNLQALVDDEQPDIRKASLYERNGSDWVRLGANVEGNRIRVKIEHAGVYRVLYDAAIVVTPEQPVLRQNYPNPFNPSTTIEYDVAVSGHVDIAVYNMLGQKISTLINGFHAAGVHRVVWDGTSSSGRRVASGIYIYRIQTGTFVQSRKMVLTK